MNVPAYVQDREWKLKEHWELEQTRGREAKAEAEEEEGRLSSEIRRLTELVHVGERELERRDVQVVFSFQKCLILFRFRWRLLHSWVLLVSVKHLCNSFR